jgi:UDP-glucose 4-epimerase
MNPYQKMVNGMQSTKQKKCVLVVGGAGFIGSHVNKMLHQKGYDTVILDNLSRGNQKAIINGTFVHGDMSDNNLLNQIFSTHAIDAVMHFAALTDVGESMTNPLKYYINNVANTLLLLNSMLRHGVKIFIFSSSAAIFGNPIIPKVSESHPCQPINPYGQTKLMVETILRDLDLSQSIKSCSLRYFNAAGGDPEGIIKLYKRHESNLIPRILRNIQLNEGPFIINGTDYDTFDGTCIRDYVHIEDLGTAHISAMEQLFEGAPTNFYNLGNGQGFSVREVISTAFEVTGRQIPIQEGPRRPGDPAILVADASKAKKELLWQPRFPLLKDMILHNWQAISR